MGYFNENRLGDITAAVTTTLGDLEQMSVTIMEKCGGRVYPRHCDWRLAYDL